MTASQKTIKVLATADLHLGVPPDGMPGENLNISPSEAWRLTVQRCIDLKADALLVAGDLIDMNANFAKVSRELVQGFRTLEKAGIDIVLITGNHDYDLLPFFLQVHPFDHATLLGTDGSWSVIIKEKHGVRFGIAGRSFPEVGQQSDPLSGAEEVLDSALHPLIAMLHCDTKHPESIYGYVEVERLTELPADAWVLGHLHEKEILNEDPLIFYPGNPGNIRSGTYGSVLIQINDNYTLKAS